MATYLNNLRLKEITTGDEDGVWGTSTNTNLELITDGFSYGTKDMAADANETFTMPDATADATRGFYLKITSAVSLTATREVTLGPDTVSKVWLIENATTGSQIITIKQGSGATVDVANGSKVMIVTDGAGAGAAVLNANPTEVGGSVTSVGGTGTVNGITLTGTVTSSGNLTLGGTLANVDLTTQITGTLPVANGGTGTTATTYADLTANVTGTLPVANGGTGATTLTANNVVLGNGTSAVQVVAPSTSGNVLTSDGTTWASTAPAGGGFSTSQSIESTTTWSIPTGVTLIKIYVTGGGGGAGTGYSCGGSAGGTAIKYLDVSAGGSITITIAAGGASGSSGSAGGTSSAVYGVTTISGTGGGGGTGQYSTSGNGSGGDINISGGCGSASGYQAEMAGGSFWGGPKTLYGGGAYGSGGSSYMAYGSPIGNAGMSGVVYIEY